MSRVGVKPVTIASGVSASVDNGIFKVKGAKGELQVAIPEDVNVKVEGESVLVQRSEGARNKASWGLARSLIANAVTGVTDGFQKKLEINGVGYRAAVQGKVLNLSLGFSHPVEFPIPEGIDIKCPKPTEIEISGIDNQLVGQVAANIRKYRKPEPYKGKGVKYEGEYIFRKEGKKK